MERRRPRGGPPPHRITPAAPERCSTRFCSEEPGAGDVPDELLVLLGRPAALHDEQLPQVGEVERPEDVGGAVDVEAGRFITRSE